MAKNKASGRGHHKLDVWLERLARIKKSLGKPENEERLWSEALLKESDRGCVIFGAEVLSTQLESLLREFLRREPKYQKLVDALFEGFGPLASFSSRISIAFLLKLIPERVMIELDIIRRMRNEFAHNWGPIDFEDPKIRAWLERLIGPEKKRGPGMTKEQKLIIGQQHLSHEQGVRRLAFFFAVADNVGYLTFYHFCIQTGEDVRKLVTLTERHSPAKK